MVSKELLSEVLNKNISSYEFDMYGNIDYKVINDYGSNINIYELAFRVRDYFKLKNKHLSLNQSIGDIFIQANNNMYELDTKE